LCFFFPGLGALQYRLLRYGENTSKRKVGKQSKISEANFPRNLAPAFTHYCNDWQEIGSE
jgi:hypothetical protein